MVHGLAAQFGGELKLRNDPGTGMTAEIWLPRFVGQVTEADGQDLADAAPTLPRMRILLVDDDHLAREAVETLLTDMGQDVTSAASAEHAVGLFRRRPFDLVIADVRMPDLRGDEMAALLRAERPDTHILLLTGHPGDLSEQAQELPILLKPVRRDGLAAALVELTKDKKRLDERVS
jgi:CheY-like chemotaxis protein